MLFGCFGNCKLYLQKYIDKKISLKVLNLELSFSGLGSYSGIFSNNVRYFINTSSCAPVFLENKRCKRSASAVVLNWRNDSLASAAGLKSAGNATSSKKKKKWNFVIHCKVFWKTNYHIFLIIIYTLIHPLAEFATFKLIISNVCYFQTGRR